MAYRTWQEPVSLLSAELSQPDDTLAKLAAALGIDVASRDSRLIVIAKVEDEVSRVTGVHPPRDRSPRQADLLAELGVDGGRELTVRLADALIRTAIYRERINALRSLRPTRGERLVRTGDRFDDRVGEIVEVSSIDRLGQIWVKGARGYPTRPQDLARV